MKRTSSSKAKAEHLLYFFVFQLFCLICGYQAWADEKVSPESYSAHLQATVLPQYHPEMISPYSGVNSLASSKQVQTSITSTLFLGTHLWKNSEIYFDPEMTGGGGLSGAHGAAGFSNGETYRIDTASLKLKMARLYLRQYFRLSEDSEKIETDENQLAEELPAQRLSVVVGTFSLNDFFDNNQYAHNPRTQFMNWSFMDNGAWDYAADTRGYTWGLMLEYHRPEWSIRFASVMEPAEANQLGLDRQIDKAQGNNLEFEYHYEAGMHPGVARILTYLNHAHMGSYSQATLDPLNGVDITQTRAYRTKYGFGLNFEQEITPVLGLFSRIGWNDGSNETWAFTEIDRAFSVGASLKGTHWQREADVLGIGLAINALSEDHLRYLGAGGNGFIVGDSRLNYRPEEILETYYSYQLRKEIALSVDAQLINHPAYNADRGPAQIYSARFHFEI